MPRIAMLEGYASPFGARDGRYDGADLCAACGEAIPAGHARFFLSGGRQKHQACDARPAYDGLGTAFCREFDDARARLQMAVDAWDRQFGTLAVDQRVREARAWLEQESGFFSTWVAWGDACKGLVDETKRLLNGVNAALSQYAPGTQLVSPPDTEPPTDPFGLGSVKWILGGVVLLGAFYAFGPMLRAAGSRRRGVAMSSGYAGKRRRRARRKSR